MKNNYSIIKISAGFHQTLIVATDEYNKLIAWNSANFDNRTVAELSYNASEELATKLRKLGIDTADIVVVGPGQGREPAIRALINNGIAINLIKDKTPVPHNGIVPLQKTKKRNSSI